MLTKILILLSLAALPASAAWSVPVPTESPKFDHSFQGASFSVDVEGTFPTTYQWYRVNTRGDIAIPAPQGIQPALILKPTDVAGLYYCVATNAAGSSKSDPFRLSYTTSKTAAKMAVTIKKP